MNRELIRKWWPAALAAVVLVAGICAYFAYTYPYADRIQQKLEATLKEKGLQNVLVRVEHVEPSAVRFSTIRFAQKDLTLQFNNLSVQATSLSHLSLMMGGVSGLAGEWSFESLNVKGTTEPLPMMSGRGGFVEKQGALNVRGTVSDVGKVYRATFAYSPEQLSFSDLAFKWREGVIECGRAVFPLDKQAPVSIPVLVKKMPLANLLSMISGEKATGTGSISGKVKATIKPGGRVQLEEGLFRNDEIGVIQVAPDALPGEGPQMDMARTALSDYHYSELSLVTALDKEEKPVIQLNVNGYNPQAFDGRVIRLHVNLTGDVIGFLQQTLQAFSDPASLLKKDTL